MNRSLIFVLKAGRKIVKKCGFAHPLPLLQREMNPDKASEMIYKLLTDDKPCMIARFGSTELAAIINYLGVVSKKHSVWKFITGEQPEWWWNPNVLHQMQQWSGFFPPTHENVEKFCEMMLEDAKQVDILGSWIKNEYQVKNWLQNASFVQVLWLEPYHARNPWSRALAGKKVVVVHPFSKQIKDQYVENRTRLFANPEVLPEFRLRIVPAVQSLGGEDNGFQDWFEALEWMKSEIDKEDYDICLIGCGAYGFPLAAHCKRRGKKAIHLGGALQLLFGIKGRRWEKPNYGMKEFGRQNVYNELFNQYWIYPGECGKAKNAKQVEGSCYW